MFIYVCMYIHQLVLCSWEGWSSLLDSDSTVSKPELHMTGFFLNIRSYFLMFPQAGLFIKYVSFSNYCLTFDLLFKYFFFLDLQMCAKLGNDLLVICKHLSSDCDQQITTYVLQMIHSNVKFGGWCHKSVLEVQSHKGAFHGVPGLTCCWF